MHFTAASHAATECGTLAGLPQTDKPTWVTASVTDSKAV